MPASDVSNIAALAEPVRRSLFDFVVRSRAAVSRESAAEGLGIATHTAKFHLDRLVEEGLLEVEFKRLTGRTGPGSGRPAKLYRRTDREVEVSLPERHYDLLSRILARAVAEASASGDAVASVVARVARDEGAAWGASLDDLPGDADLERLASALDAGGYEPWIEDETLFVQNCPFHRVAQEQTELVCGLNPEFVSGVAVGVGCPGVATRLDPGEDRCCVSAQKR
ncbi:helix-turn-helix transcriptional regulator [Nocardioides sp. B-3]|uniref:helix-turn-helix transcriptional regulator n=1 Tax=Nocardioides sp. B-3 TaxID=2895565 RepID=UPI0021521584|nr:helix-turn-helix domain-containing protein [Nocardioides sp. B-3]UUZ60125.1 helix-turn-helix domain-containing protein [Nocardioides sp. B-3]